MPADVIAPTARIAVTGADGNDTFRTLVAGPEPGSAANLGCLHLNLALNNWGENGNDVFLTNVANVSLDGAVAISMAGGRGDDMFLTSLGNVAINAPMTLMNDGGLGGDNIALICGFNPQPDPPAMPGVIVNAPVDVMLDGGLGRK
jgi:hypothetical protein